MTELILDHSALGNVPVVPFPDPVMARVKWFNTEKGFGFVTPVSGEAEAFLHASTLSRAGVQNLPDGVELLCEVASGPKGIQVVRVLDVRVPETQPKAPENTMLGSVKWYQPEKGFGFVIGDDGGRDIFVHRSILRRINLDDILQGTRVRIAVANTNKGREATWLELVEPVSHDMAGT